MSTEPKELTDAELEAHIGDCARLMEQAFYLGNRAEAEQFREDMYTAIAMRSPEQVRRMEIERGLDEGDYFSQQGELDRLVLQGRLVA